MSLRDEGPRPEAARADDGPPEDDPVDEASRESFPASDPPPFWARETGARPREDRSGRT